MSNLKRSRAEIRSMEHVGEQQVDSDILDVDELVVGLFAIKLDEIGVE